MKETLSKLRSSLIPIYGKGEAEAIIRIIFHYLKGWNLTDILIHADEDLSSYIKGEVDSILERLLNNEPIQYITGEARFHGMQLKSRPGVLIPRPETDELVDIIIDDNKYREDLNVLDLCTGSGCIAIALARNLPFSKVTALDSSNEAVALAKENAQSLKVRLDIIQNDIFDWIPDKSFDIIVSNPPYVLDKEALDMSRNVLDYEPHEAIFVRDDDSLVFYRRIAHIAKKSLVKAGKLYLEINPLTSDDLVELLKREGFIEINEIKDIFGKKRFISAILTY